MSFATSSISTTEINGYFYSVALSSDGTKGIAGSAVGNGIYFTTNSGATWTQSNITSGGFNSVALSSDGTNGIAGSVGNGIYYTTNTGATWAQSTLIDGVTPTSGSFYSVELSSNGTIGISGSASGNGLYLTTDSGTTWAQSSVTTGNFNSVALSLIGTKGIAGSSSGNGIYYNTSSLCYEKNTLILVLEKGAELYKKICELKVGDVVKTYKHGYKKIKMIKSFHYNTSNITRLKRCMYKMKDHDIIVTGKHGLLVDEITTEEIKNIKKCGIILRNIDDKQVLPACASDKFEKITDIFEFELWHFVLDNDDESKNYGIYITDGILSESCSEKAFLNA